MLNQVDADFDRIGDACDPFPNSVDHDQARCEEDLASSMADLLACGTSKDQCLADLVAIGGGAFTQCQASLGQCNEVAAQCGSELQACTANLAQVTGELATERTARVAAQADLAQRTQERDAALARIAELEAANALLTAGLDACRGNPPNLACAADITGDGVVNFRDLALLKGVFFQRCVP